MMGFIRRRNICFQVSQQYLYFMHEINGGDGPGPEVSLVLLHITCVPRPARAVVVATRAYPVAAPSLLVVVLVVVAPPAVG